MMGFFVSQAGAADWVTAGDNAWCDAEDTVWIWINNDDSGTEGKFQVQDCNVPGYVNGVATLSSNAESTVIRAVDEDLKLIEFTVDANGASVIGRTFLSDTLTVQGATTLRSTLGVSGNLTVSGATNTIGNAGTSANTMTGATNTITGTTGSLMTGSNAGVALVADSASMSVTGGSTLTATDTTATVLTADGHGLTVDQGSATTTLSGGTNSSTLTLADDYATLGVGTASTSEITVLNATNDGTVTSVTIGGIDNGSNSILATAAGGINVIQADATNTLTAGTGNIITATTGSNTISALGVNGTNNLTANATTGINNIEASASNIGVTTVASVNTIGNAGTSINTMTGATNTIVGTTGSVMTGGNAGVALVADSAIMGVTGGATVAATDTTATVVTADGHGLTVDQTSHTTTLTGGSTSTSLTLADTGATFQNDNTSGPARVTGIADGADDYDAVNMRQYWKLEDRVDSGVASVAALAAIRSSTPGKTVSLGLGYGNFRGQNAMAFGGSMLVGKSISLNAGIGYCDSTATTNAGIVWSF